MTGNTRASQVGKNASKPAPCMFNQTNLKRTPVNEQFSKPTVSAFPTSAWRKEAELSTSQLRRAAHLISSHPLDCLTKHKMHMQHQTFAERLQQTTWTLKLFINIMGRSPARVVRGSGYTRALPFLPLGSVLEFSFCFRHENRPRKMVSLWVFLN